MSIAPLSAAVIVALTLAMQAGTLWARFGNDSSADLGRRA